MRWQDGLRLCLGTLTSRPLRSLLTLLGVAIGIAAVALLTAMGEGLRLYVLDNFSQFGTRIIAIHPGKTQTGGLGGILSSVRFRLKEAAPWPACPFALAPRLSSALAFSSRSLRLMRGGDAVNTGAHAGSSAPGEGGTDGKNDGLRVAAPRGNTC